MAQALVRFLENQYVRYDDVEQRFVRGVFMLPGHGNVVGLGQALQQEAHDLEIHQGKNEQGMTHVAVAFAKHMKRKQIFAVTSSVGPGAANMVTACATATANNIPVLVLPGDVYACRQPDPVLQQIEQPHDLSLSTNDAFRPVCRYSGPHRAPRSADERHAQRFPRPYRSGGYRRGMHRHAAGCRGRSLRLS